jgi:hypothetical protein
MQELDVSPDLSERNPAKFTDHLLRAIPRLTNLTFLKIGPNLRGGPYTFHLRDDNIDTLLSRLLQHQTKLQFLNLRISCGDNSDTTDAFVDHVTRKNPGLRELYLNPFVRWHADQRFVGSKSMKSIARLKHLQVINSQFKGSDHIEDVLILLRGKSRHYLKKIALFEWDCTGKEDQLPLIASELIHMQEENGSSYNFAHHEGRAAFCKIIRNDWTGL